MVNTASEIIRRMDNLIQQQIDTLHKPGPLSPGEVFEFRLRVAEIEKLIEMLDKARPKIPWPSWKTTRTHPSL